jgi:hypothetical protein
MVDGLAMDYSCIDDASRGSDLVCTLTPLFAEIKDINRHPKIPGNALSNTLLKSRFQNFAADAAKQKVSCQKPRCTRCYENRTSRGFDS